jgi:hypothetical protein
MKLAVTVLPSPRVKVPLAVLDGVKGCSHGSFR